MEFDENGELIKPIQKTKTEKTATKVRVAPTKVRVENKINDDKTQEDQAFEEGDILERVEESKKKVIIKM